MSAPRDPPSATFVVESRATGKLREFRLNFWSIDKSVSLYDPINKNIFLKRITPPENINIQVLRAGASIQVCGRPLTVVAPCDEITIKRLAGRGSMLLVVKPDAIDKLGDICSLLQRGGLELTRLRMLRMNEDAPFFREFLDSLKITMNSEEATHIASDRIVAIEVTGDDIMAVLHELCGPGSPSVAREVAPSSIRALYGKGRTDNAVWVSSVPNGPEIAFMFDRPHPTTATFKNCALCIIKPHVIESRQLGNVLRDIISTGGFDVSALRSVSLNRSVITDLLEVYRGVCPEYESWVVEMSSSPALMLEVRGDDVVPRLRDLAGPYDSVIAKALRPETLRAKYGVDGVRNVVHVTDIAQDGPLESKFMFHVMGKEI